MRPLFIPWCLCSASILAGVAACVTAGRNPPVPPHKPNETQVVDVAALQAQKLLPPDAQWASVILSAGVSPDELLAVAASYDGTGHYGAQTPFNDQLATHCEGGKWEVDGTHNSLVTVANGGNTTALALLTILYNQGSGQYQVEQTLAPGEQMALDFGKLIHGQVPDKNGRTLPPDLTWGAYRIVDLNDNPTGSLYEGKVVVDKTFGHAAYGCMICCGPNNPWMTYDPLILALDSSDDQGVPAINSCTERQVTVTSYFPTWWTDNTAIATATNKQINGVALGTTNNNAQSINMYWGPKEDSGGQACPLSQEQPSAPTNVTPMILFGGPSGTNITGTTQSVVVGQQVILYAKYPSGLTVNSQGWVLPGSNIAGYTPSSSSSGLNVNETINEQSVTFYWVIPANSQTVTFVLYYGNSQNATAQATFNIAGVTSPSMSVQNFGQLTIDNLTGCSQQPGGPALVYGNISGPTPPCPGSYTGTAGILFTPQGTPPSGGGSFSFVQLIDGDTTTYSGTAGTLTCSFNADLDTGYPYPQNSAGQATDAPFVPLPSTYTTVSRSFNASMYLLWTPNPASGCPNGSACTVPVPLGYQKWQFSGSTTQSNGSWGSPTGSGGPSGSFVAALGSASSPSWNGVSTRTCQ